MSSPPRYFRPELDALRFFAFLCVFFYHRMDYVPLDRVRNPILYPTGIIGAFGVPVFFLLSAFLITELLFRERDRTGHIHIRSFYIRRILRIWPLYFLAFFGLALLNHFTPDVGTGSLKAWAYFTLFAGNWYITLHGWIAGSVDPLWSISVEEQFYLAIPILAAFGGRRAVAIVSTLLLLGSSLTVLLYALHHAPEDAGEWTNSFTHFQFFAAGTLLSLALRGRLPTLAIPLRLLGFALGFASWFTAYLHFRVESWNPQPTPTNAVLGWALVLLGAILFFLSTLGTPSRYIPAWFAYCGRISYGLYLVHSLTFTLLYEKLLRPFFRHHPTLHVSPFLLRDVGTLLVLTLSLLAAHLSYTCFESYFLRLKHRFTIIPARD